MYTKLRDCLKGRKTYIIAGLLVLASLVEVITGDMTVLQLLEDQNLLVLLNGLGLAALRAGVSK